MISVAGGDYCDDWRQVSMSYLQGFFLFDVVTSFPVSFFELSAQMSCSRESVDGPVLPVIHLL